MEVFLKPILLWRGGGIRLASAPAKHMLHKEAGKQGLHLRPQAGLPSRQ